MEHVSVCVSTCAYVCMWMRNRVCVSDNVTMVPSLLSTQWREHVCHADRVSPLHSGTLQHHHTPCQDAGEQDEPHSRTPL